MKDVNLLVANGVNIQNSLEIFGDMTTYDETLEDFLSAVGGKLAKIQLFKETSDMANYAILVHSLKSDAKYFGFEKLAEIAYKHELESKANNIYFVSDNYAELMVEANRIVSLVKQYLGKEPVISAAPQQVVNVADVQPVSSKAQAILVVDDSNVISNFVKKIFDDNFDVLIANDGKEAIDIVEQNSAKIIGMLLDLNMPNVDGFAVLDYFKEKDLFKKIPVSIITGNDAKDVDAKAFGYPIVDMLKKPFNERSVRSIIERMILFNNQS